MSRCASASGTGTTVAMMVPSPQCEHRGREPEQLVAGVPVGQRKVARRQDEDVRTSQRRQRPPWQRVERAGRDERVGFSAAILIDATIVRAVLLPATMKLLGEWNWYLPRWLERLPRLDAGEEPAPQSTPAPVA
jgi:hypothetical protein